MTDIGSPVRLYVIVYETICPLGTAGGDQENKMEKDSITSGAKLSGGLPGAMEIYTQLLHDTIIVSSQVAYLTGLSLQTPNNLVDLLQSM